MKIAQLLGNSAFGPLEIEALSTAYETALRRLGLSNRTDAICETVAHHIINVAQAGLSDPDGICSEALRRMGIPQDRGGADETDVMRRLMTRAGEITGISRATAQLIEPKYRYLKIVDHRGFAPDFIQHFDRVDRDSGTMCGRAMLCRSPIIVEDALCDQASRPHRHVFENASVRTVLSMPVITPRGTFYGMVSVHKSYCGLPSTLEVSELARAATIAAEAIATLRGKKNGSQAPNGTARAGSQRPLTPG